MVINVNMYDYYPEFPYTLKKVKKKPKTKRKDVWAEWKTITPEMEEMAFLNDISSGFEPERFIKDAEVVEKCKDILKSNFKELNAVFLELSGKSKLYPEIEADVFLDFVMNHQHSPIFPPGSTPIPKA